MNGLVRTMGYVGFTAENLDAWKSFAHDVLNAQAMDMEHAGHPALGVRFDDQHHRFLVTQSDDPGHTFFGLQVASASDLEELAQRLSKAGIAVTAATPDELAVRHVAAMYHFKDPVGHRVEIFHGPERADFKSPRPSGGFRMGDMGFGHMVLMTPKYESTRDFYMEHLNFKVSDYILKPSRRTFMHINARHHSLGLAERPQAGVAHLMVEVNSLDDLGRAYDVVQRDHANLITSSLGRHTNDHMTSFYVATPSGFPLEYGWGGRQVGPDWKVEELMGPSLWGHDRRSSSADVREFNDGLRRAISELGTREPVQAHPDAQAFDLSRI